jgi:hypothetical protein
MKQRLAIMLERHEFEPITDQAREAEQVAALRAMAHVLSTQSLPRKGEITTAGGTRVRWSFHSTETRQ